MVVVIISIVPVRASILFDLCLLSICVYQFFCRI